MIEWDTWSGTARVLVETLDRYGRCSLLSRDGHAEYHERIPRGARPSTPADAAAFRERVRPRPIAYE